MLYRMPTGSYIVEFVYPGTWIDHADRAWVSSIEVHLYSLVSTIADAALALSMFEAGSGRRASRPGFARQERERQRRDEIESALRAELDPGGAKRERLEEIRRIAEVEAKHEKWAAGVLPDSYEHRMPFLHARAFLFALDRLDRCLDALANSAQVPKAVAEAHNRLGKAIPHLRGVRNSVTHFEDRSRGLDQKGRRIALQPIENRMICAPSGALILEALNDRSFGSVMADGHYGEVEVSAATLQHAAECVQSVIDAFTWHGPVRHIPD